MSGAFVVFAPTNTQLEIVVMAVVVHVHVNEKRRMVEEKKKREEGRVSGRRGKIRGGGKVKGWWGKIAEMAYLIYVLVCLPCVSNSFLLFLTIFLLLFFSSSRGGNCERERGGGRMKILQDRWKKKLSPRDVKDSFDIHTDATRRNM